MQYNISPETLIQPEDYDDDMRRVIEEGVSVEKLLNQEIDLTWMKGRNITLTPSGQFFRTDIKGFLPEMLETKYNDRKAIKNKMLQCQRDYETGKADESILVDAKRYETTQLAKKVSLNSAYGNLGTEFSRYYDVRLASSVTAGARLSLLWIKNRINAWMNKASKNEGKDYILAGDTDSLYIHFEDIVKRTFGENPSNTQEVVDFLSMVASTHVSKVISKGYEDLARYVNAPEQKMRMKREVIAERAVWTAKKRYAMTVFNGEDNVTLKEPHYKIIGLEIIKSSTPKAIREKLMDAVKIVLNGTEKELQDYVKQVEREFFQLSPEEISFPKGVNGIKKYSDGKSYKKGTPINSRAAILYNNLLKEKSLEDKYQSINDGDKIRFVYLKMPNPLHEDVIGFPKYLPQEFDLHEYVNYYTQFDKVFIKPLENILEVINWNYKKKKRLS